MINQENRRVELIPIIDTPKSIKVDIQKTTPPDIARMWSDLLVKNPDIDIIIEGGGSVDDFADAFKFKQELVSSMPDDKRDKVFVSLKGETEHYLKLNSDGVIIPLP